MPLFEITYTDPDSGEEKTIEHTFEDSATATAMEWAEDYAYILADKGYYSIKEIKRR